MKLSISLLIGTLLFSFQSQAATKAKYVINWSIAHGPALLVEKSMNMFAKEVYERTNGEVQVQVTKNKARTVSPYLIDIDTNKQALEQLVDGKIQMAQIYTTYTGYYYAPFWALSSPYLFKNDAHVFAVLDGEVGQKLNDGLLERTKVLRNLAFTYSGGFKIIASDKGITNVDDFQHLKMGQPVPHVMQETFAKLGISTFATNKYETLKNYSKGNVNAIETTYVRFNNSGERKRIKTLNETGHTVLISSLLINEVFFKTLPEKYQTIVKEAAYKSAVLERKISIDESLRIKKDLMANGYTINELSLAEREKAKALLSGTVETFAQFYGKDIIQKINEAASITIASEP